MRHETSIMKRLQEILGNEVEVKPVTKDCSGGETKEGFVFREKVSNIGVCVYVDTDSLSEGDPDVNEIAETLVREYKQHKSDVRFDESCFTKENILNRVLFKLVAAENNEKYLEGKVSSSYLDMKLVYIYKPEGFENGYITITKKQAAAMDISEEELYQAASENIDNAEYCIKNFFGVMTVLTSEEPFGATGILRADMLRKLSDQFVSEGESPDYWLLPSSIHEFIAIPQGENDPDPADLAEIICGVNREVVDPEEVLGSHAYKYSAETREVSIA